MAFHPLTDPDHRAGLALVAGGLGVSAVLLFAQAARPPLALLGFGDANAASGLLFVMAGGVLLVPPSASLSNLRPHRLARLFAALGLVALAVPALLRPWFAL